LERDGAAIELDRSPEQLIAAADQLELADQDRCGTGAADLDGAAQLGLEAAAADEGAGGGGIHVERHDEGAAPLPRRAVRRRGGGRLGGVRRLGAGGVDLYHVDLRQPPAAEAA